MTIEKLHDHHQRWPFEPFDMITADGQRYHVDHPEFLMQSRSGRTVNLTLGDDQDVEIDLLLITALKTAANAQGAESQ